MKKRDKKNSNLMEFLKWIETIIIAIVIALLIRGFILEPVIVNGVSMEDTLFSEQRLIIYKLGYFFHPPQKGDIIVLQYQKGLFGNIPILNKLSFLNRVIPSVMEIDYIKRVIGVPGDKIDIKDGHVYINGEKLDEKYAKGETHKQLLDFPKTVPPNTVFVLGDNRQNSRDSRIIGFIEYDRIKGKAVLRIWPFKDLGVIK
ncbi:MAG TPA: signal peptidase I [Clostridiaceae bacterium]|nr:signal peptidase I [Clostridiaceae bacterium]